MRICAYVSSSSKVPILRCSLETGRHVHPVFEAIFYSRGCESRFNLLHTHENELPCEKRAPVSSAAPKNTLGTSSGAIDILRRTSSGKCGELCEATKILTVEFYYVENYATRNAVKEYALINKYPWKVSVYAYAIHFLAARHRFVRSVCAPFKEALRN